MTPCFDPSARTPQDRDRDHAWLEDDESIEEWEAERNDRYDEFGSEWLTQLAEDIAVASKAAKRKAA